MKIAVGCDHGGLEYKNAIAKHLIDEGHEVIDVGTYSSESCHYPVFGEAVARKVASKECEYGVVVCTSGEGIAISANKVKGVRCGIAYNDDVTFFRENAVDNQCDGSVACHVAGCPK